MTLQLRPTFSESWYRVQNLRPKLRAGAQISRQFYRGERWYVVRDPAGNQYHRLSDAAYKFVGLLDGQRTIGEAWELVGGQLADDAPTQPEVIQILSQLYSANLIETNISPDATVLLRRHKRMMMHKAKGRLMNILFPRIPLWDPDWFLKYFMPLVRPMLSKIGTIIWLIVVITAIVLCAPHWDKLYEQGRQSIQIWQNPINALWLYLAFALIKFIHELGHGFMCRRFGGEVHEMGIMFLVLFPAPYVDASSAWSFPNKWHRMLVGMGGMIFELFVAAICAFGWLAVKDSADSFTSLFLYNIMLIASFSTVIFNANPLLRYDGYYILSDWLEIPNLQHRSREYSLSLIKRHLFRVKWSQPLPAPGQRPWLVAYFATSGPYRLMIGMFILIMVLYQLPEQVKLLGMIMGLGSLATFFVLPLYKSFTYLAIEPELHRKRGLAWAWTLGFLAVAIFCLGFIRFPLNVRAEAVVLPEDWRNVYPTTPGFLAEVRKRDGERVEAGDVLYVLRNDELEADLARLEAEVEGAKIEWLAAQADNPVDAAAAEQKMMLYRKELDQARRRREELIIRAAISGQLVASKVEQKIGSYITFAEQQPLARVINPRELVGYAIVDQNEVGLLREAEAHAVRSGATDRDGQPSQGYRTSVRLVSAVPTELELGEGQATLKPAGTRLARSPLVTNVGGGLHQADPRDPSGRQLQREEFEFEFKLNNPNGYYQPNQRAYVRIQVTPPPPDHWWELPQNSVVRQGWRRLNQLIQTTGS